VEFTKGYEAGISRAMISIENAAHAMRKDDRTTALTYLWEAVSASPGFPEAHYQLALALMPTNARASEAQFVRVVELDPRHPPAHYQLGVLRARRNDVAGAMASLRRAIELAPGFIEAHRELATQAWKQEDWTTVFASLRAIVAWDPADADAHYALSRALTQQGDHAAAARELAIAQRLKPSPR
jgi:tetratricopeptide (TPR) repeat protein